MGQKEDKSFCQSVSLADLARFWQKNGQKHKSLIKNK